MKKWISIFCFFMVTFALTASIVSDLVEDRIECKSAEKGQKNTETEDDYDQEKDKIVYAGSSSINILLSQSLNYSLSVSKLISSVLDTDINPPEGIVA